MCGNHGSSLVSYTGDPTIVEPHKWQQDLLHLPVASTGARDLGGTLVRAMRTLCPDRLDLWYDEIRVAGVCDRCRASGKTTGQLLTEACAQDHSHVPASIARNDLSASGTTCSIRTSMRSDRYYTVKEGFEGLERHRP